VVGSLWLARGGLSRGYPLYVKLSWGAGLKTGAPVWVSGAGVGYVANVQFRTDGSLLTELRIQSSQPIPRGSAAAVVPDGFFGDVAVNFTPVRSEDTYRPGDTVMTGIQSTGVAAVLGKVDSIATGVNAITGALSQELVAGGGLADLRKTLASTNRLVETLMTIATEQSHQLSATMASLRRATAAVDSAKIDSTLTNLRTSSARVLSLTSVLDSTSREMRQIVTKVDSGNGTVGKFLNDPAIYDDLHRLLRETDSLVADLKKNPKRYVPPIKVF
jgi:phospholipid/cholesterol/gamma-HCH transport system substrate-binding protein